jgi:hypothetical protein
MWQLRDRHVLRGPGSCLLTQDSSGTAMCHQGSSSRLLAQDSSEAAMCPMGRSYGLRAIKVNKYYLAA